MQEMLIAAVALIVIALIIMLFSRSQAVQRFAALELACLSITVFVAGFGAWKAQSFMETQYFSLFQVYLGDARQLARDVETDWTDKTAAEWQTIGDELTQTLAAKLPVTTIDGAEYTYLSAGIYERVEENIYTQRVYRTAGAAASTEKECLHYIQKYGEEAAQQGEAVYAKTDDASAVMVYTGSGVVSPKCVYLTEISLAPLNQEVEQMQREYMLYGGLFLLAATLFFAILTAVQGRQMRRLLCAVVRVAEGKEGLDYLEKKTSSIFRESNDVRRIKNSIAQILRNVERTNYTQYRILQKYYRFAPKQIEKIFGKNSILEVENNDCVTLTGTVAFMAYPEHRAFEEREYLKNMEQVFEKLGEKQKEYGGIFLSNNSDLTTQKLLFQEQTIKALQFGISRVTNWEENHKKPLFVMLHRASILYGVTGSEEQAFTYMISREMKILESYVEDFRKIGVRMVVTDTVYEMIEKETTGRYIGYLEKDGFAFKIYEILDAFPAKERKRRLDAKEKFNRALNLFYQEDYYLGRNLFTEVLKECPEDEVTKWYLFLCEECLNAEAGKHISSALFSR